MTINTGGYEKAMLLQELTYGKLPAWATELTSVASWSAEAGTTEIDVADGAGFQTDAHTSLILIEDSTGLDDAKGIVVSNEAYSDTTDILEVGIDSAKMAGTASSSTIRELAVSGENFFKYLNIESFEPNIDNQVERGRGLNALPYDSYAWDNLSNISGSLKAEVVDGRCLFPMIGDGTVNSAQAFVGTSDILSNTQYDLPSFTALLQINLTEAIIVRGIKFGNFELEWSKDNALILTADWQAKCTHRVTYTVPGSDNAHSTSPKGCLFTWMDGGTITLEWNGTTNSYKFENFHFKAERKLKVERPVHGTQPARSATDITCEKWITSWNGDVLDEGPEILNEAIGSEGYGPEKYRDMDGTLAFTTTGKPGTAPKTIAIASDEVDIADIKRPIQTAIETRMYTVSGGIRGWSITIGYNV